MAKFQLIAICIKDIEVDDVFMLRCNEDSLKELLQKKRDEMLDESIGQNFFRIDVRRAE